MRLVFRYKFIVAVIVATIAWWFISYQSYYYGLASQIMTDNSFSLKIAKEIFNSNTKFESVLEKYKEKTAFFRSGIKIINIDNNKEWIVREPLLIGDGNNKTIKIDKRNFAKDPIETKNGRLKFEFTFSVEPVAYIGIFRAYTLSLSDMLMDKGYKDLSISEKFSKWWGSVVRGNWRRSFNLGVFLAMFWIILRLYEKQYKKFTSIEKEKNALDQLLSDNKQDAENIEKELRNLKKEGKQNVEKISEMEGLLKKSQKEKEDLVMLENKMLEMLYEIDRHKSENQDLLKELQNCKNKKEDINIENIEEDAKANEKRVPVEKRWSNAFPKFVFASGVIKDALKYFKFEDLGNLERELMEIHESENRYKRSKRFQGTEDYEWSFNVIRIHYRKLERNQSNKDKEVEITEIYKKHQKGVQDRINKR
ncbi:MAG: hypothetical protein FWF00_07330 [Endomicrobia bacterium]|nr:hypothetical protein [Endomicrobiia bacterium]MCL2507478.1 hypothetical protein [Endomicrobiia bacterium]